MHAVWHAAFCLQPLAVPERHSDLQKTTWMTFCCDPAQFNPWLSLTLSLNPNQWCAIWLVREGLSVKRPVTCDITITARLLISKFGTSALDTVLQCYHLQSQNNIQIFTVCSDTDGYTTYGCRCANPTWCGCTTVESVNVTTHPIQLFWSATIGFGRLYVHEEINLTCS